MTSQHNRAWSDFWARNRASGNGGGCLPAKWQGIDAAQQAIWHRFARNLPKKAQILDIATGDGRVLAWLLAKRRDLKPLGVDMAPELPEPPKGAKVRSGISMENLPFPDRKFAAATSQFGFEYGDTTKAASEISRVVTKGGAIGILTHRQDGPILAHNLKRREQINWVLEDQDLIETAKRSLKARATGLQTISPKIANAPIQGARLFGDRSAAWEISEAVRQTMTLGMRDHPSNVARLLDTIASRAGNELGRIASLEEACRRTADETQFQSEIEMGGLQQVAVEPVLEQESSQPFADFRLLRHWAV